MKKSGVGGLQKKNYQTEIDVLLVFFFGSIVVVVAGWLVGWIFGRLVGRLVGGRQWTKTKQKTKEVKKPSQTMCVWIIPIQQRQYITKKKWSDMMYCFWVKLTRCFFLFGCIWTKKNKTWCVCVCVCAKETKKNAHKRNEPI